MSIDYDVKTITLRNKRYRVVFATYLGESNSCNGLCSSPYESHKKIYFRKSLREQERLRIFIHEMLHACFWEFDEEAIDHGSADCAKALWKFGYRLLTDKTSRSSKDPSSLVIRNKRYIFQRVSGLPKNCNSIVIAPHQSKKIIQFRTSLKNKKELTQLIKSFLRIAYWDIDDEFITDASFDISNALWRFGYRRA